MTRFDALMDDMKKALIISGQYKSLFLPALIINILLFVFIVIAIFSIIAMAISIGVVSANGGFQGNIGTIIGMVVFILIVIVFFTLLTLAVDLGINSLVINAADGIAPSPKNFFKGIKENIVPVFFAGIGLNIIIFFAFILLIVPLILYFVIAGILTGGWGITLFSCTFQGLLGYWTLIKMQDHRGSFESVGVSIKFGRKYYWLIVLMVYLQVSFAAYFPALLGIIGAAFASLFISYAMLIYFKLVYLLTYRRHTGYISPVEATTYVDEATS